MSTPTIETFSAFLDRGEIEGCRTFLDGAHASSSQDAVYLTLRADFLRRAGDMPGALACCLELSRLHPTWDRHRYTMADVASHLGCAQEVLPAFERIASNFVPAVANQIRAEAWHVLGLDADVIGLRPDTEVPHSSDYLTRLCVGQSLMRSKGLAIGLPEYARGWTNPAALQALGYLTAAQTEDFWYGQSAPPAVLKVTRRGGIGDYLLWARYLPLLEAQGVEVVHATGLDTQLRPLPAASGLLQQHPGEGAQAAARAAMWADPFTLFTALFPRFGYAQRPSYYHPPPSANADAIAKLARLKARGKPCWALFWSANESHGSFALKSACLPHVAPLFEANGVHWIVMQRGHQLKLWLDDPRHEQATTLTEPLSIDDTASLLAQLDGAVVVDTAIAHIAAAIGTPTYLLASRAACWRYEQLEKRTPWYGSMTLFRQPSLGDWDGAVKDVAAALPT